MVFVDTIAAAPLAVHLSANVLQPSWTVLGFVGMAGLVALGFVRLREEEIPRIGLMTAALFVGSSIHVSLGPTSVHLLLNGLAGVILGRRVGIAVPVGLLLQATLLGHGDLSTLGVNSCVMTLPALAARRVFHLVLANQSTGLMPAGIAVACLLWPWSILATPLIVWLGRGLRLRPDVSAAQRAGFVIGAGSVFLTSLLHSLVLAIGGSDDWSIIAAASLAAHLPVAMIEGIILATTVDFLMRVKPSLLLGESATRAGTPHPAVLPTGPIPH